MFSKLITFGALATLAATAPTQDSMLQARQGIPPGDACGPDRHETKKVGDGRPTQDIYHVQISGNQKCVDGDCDITREESTPREISASFSIDSGNWISGDFSVSETRSTGTTNRCGDSGHDSVCMWSTMYHTGYLVQDWKSRKTAFSCSEMTEDGDEYIIRSPNENNEGAIECRYDDDCEHEGADHWDYAVSEGGPP